jgi:hypothetical protein
MKRKLHSLFDEGSPTDDHTDSPLAPAAARTRISWRLQSTQPHVNPSIPLVFNQNNICVLGRKDFSNSKFISTIHCEIFQNSSGELFLSSQARYDVIYVDNALAAKDSPVLLKDRNEIRFCKGHFIYQLEKQIFKEEEEEEEGQEEEHNVTIELSAVTHENEMRERMEMALEDLDAMIRARHLRDLNNTQATCRKLLSSFYCDICIEVIASCRSCVPCGHNYCFPCITQYMAVSKK